MDDLVLHVGAPKTGTKLIQKCLIHNAKRLEQTGVRVATRGDLRAFHRSAERRFDPSGVDWERFWRSLNRAKHVLLSEEGLMGPMSSVVRQRGLFAQAVPRLEHVLERCPARRVRVILRTRRQDAYLESVYLQRVRMGSTESWDAFMAHVDVERLSWLDLVNRLSDLLGPSQVGVRPFEEIRHGARPYLRRFLADAGLTPDASFEFSTGTQNRGYSEPALRIGLVANQVLEAHDRKQLRHYLDQHLSTRTHPRAVLMSDDQRREMLRGLERDNELVMAMTGPPTDVSYSPAALVS